MPAQRLKPETKTLRYMINVLGMRASPASRRMKKLSFDMFGFVDVVGFKPRGLGDARTGAGPLVFVQACSSTDQSKRKRKILETERLAEIALDLVRDGHHVEVWAWVTGRHARAEAFRRWTLSASTCDWTDRGIVEVHPEGLVAPKR